MERETQTYFFPDDGRIPNHPDFPLVVYQNALKDTGLAERSSSGMAGQTAGQGVFFHTIIITAIRMKS